MGSRRLGDANKTALPSILQTRLLWMLARSIPYFFNPNHPSMHKTNALVNLLSHAVFMLVALLCFALLFFFFSTCMTMYACPPIIMQSGCVAYIK